THSAAELDLACRGVIPDILVAIFYKRDGQENHWDNQACSTKINITVRRFSTKCYKEEFQ
ncbi:hypothetical protein, partial [Anaerotruncus massiliensis (ex Liu et al. 2021)]|uniref:hypothetical protein n=1 Tax=Anaerotruncus massiliensis (ex Liu et al. 2021) TaxID=2321404 RepID=UPI003AB727E6